MMTDRLLLVSTCGTSLLTNGTSTEDRVWLTKVANERKVDAARLASIVDACRKRLNTADDPTRQAMSAELSGVGVVFERYRTNQLAHLLIQTDTALGKATADLAQTVLGNRTSLVSAYRHQLAAHAHSGTYLKLPMRSFQFELDLSGKDKVTTFAQEEIQP